MGAGDPVVPGKVRVPTYDGLARPRLDDLLDQARTKRLTLVTGRPGSGKTTLLSMLARRQGDDRRPVAWYEAENTDGTEQGFLRHLRAALQGISTEGRQDWGPPWESVDLAVSQLEGLDDTPTLVVIDDGHNLWHTPAEAALARLVTYMPPWMHLIVSARVAPTMSLSRLRLSDELAEIDGEDLRFRPWEIEELFSRHYLAPLENDELTQLARRTDGWAAGLKLFHLAVRSKAPSQRRAVLTSMSRRSVELRQYLADNVMAGLDGDTRRFLIHTCVLGTLRADWCDQLLDSNSSAVALRRIEAENLFVTSNDEGTTFTQHEVLRSYLEEQLINEIGEEAARRQFLRAGRLLEQAAQMGQALRAYCRAEDWEAADKLLRTSGDVAVADEPWTASLPASLTDRDAWMLLAQARRQASALRWSEAARVYRRAEEQASGSLVLSTCRSERRALVAWTEPGPPILISWTDYLRSALTRSPSVSPNALSVLDDGQSTFIRAVSAAAAGQAAESARLFSQAERQLSSPELGAWAVIGGAIASRLEGATADHQSFERAVSCVEGTVPTWLGRLLRAVIVAGGESLGKEGELAGQALADAENPWMESVTALITGIGGMLDGRSDDALTALAASRAAASKAGGGVIKAWASALAYIAGTVQQSGTANRLYDEASADGRSAACFGSLDLLRSVQSVVKSQPGPRLETTATPKWKRSLLDLVAEAVRIPDAGHGSESDGYRHQPPHPERANGADDDGGPPVQIRCLGPFTLTIGGVNFDSTEAKPKIRSLLHLLSIKSGAPTHRDTLKAALWPDDSEKVATHNLQVAMSTLRRLVDRQMGDGASAIFVRKGDTYAIGGHVCSDISLLEDCLQRGRQATGASSNDEAISAFAGAVALYSDELLPEEGSADWVVEPRDRYRNLAASAASNLSSLYLQQKEYNEAIEACEWGLRLDRYNDGLWRLLLNAHQDAGNAAAAKKVEGRYKAVLAEIGS